MHQEIKKHLDKRSKSIQTAEHAYGTAVKARRLALQYTLEEASENVCSVSYLSKVENYQIIPSLEKRLLLEEKLNLTDIQINKDTFFDLTEDWIHYLLQTGDVTNRLLNYPTEDNHFGLFHKHLLSKTLKKEIDAPLHTLFEYFNMYSEEQIFMLLYLEALDNREYFYSAKAYEVLKWIKLEEIVNKKLLFLYYSLKIKLDFDLHKVHIIEADFNIFNQLSIELNLYHETKDLHNRVIALKTIYSSTPMYEEMSDFFLTYVSYFENKPLVRQFDGKFKSLADYIYAYTFNTHPIETIVSTLKDSFHIVYQYLRIKATHNPELMMDHIRYMVISEPLSYYDYMSVHFVLTESIAELTERHFYKEAYTLSQRLFVLTQQMKKS